MHHRIIGYKLNICTEFGSSLEDANNGMDRVCMCVCVCVCVWRGCDGSDDVRMPNGGKKGLDCRNPNGQ